MKIWLDSETYSDTDISKGVMNYTKACYPILITYAFDNEPVQLWQFGEPLPQDLINNISAGHLVYAHNALFDYLALKDHLPLTLKQMRDTMAVATANHLPASLDGAGALLNISNQKQSTGKALIRRFCLPNKLKTRTLPEDAPVLWLEFVEYAVVDVMAMREVYYRCFDLTDYEWQAWLFTQRMNLAGVPVNIQSAIHFKDLSHKVKEALNIELYQLTGIDSSSKVAQLKAWLNNAGCPVEGLAKDDIREALETTTDETVKRVLEIRQQASKTSVKKFDVLIDTAYLGRIYGAFMYHGASTGRYASRGGLNLQNVSRGTEKDAVAAYLHIKGMDIEDYDFFYGANIDPLSSVIRPTIEAPQGRKFVDYDFSSIENRCAPWIAGEDSHLDLFRQGLDEYKDFATQVYNVRYEDVTKDQRTQSKPAVLSALFGSGAIGVRSYYAQYGIEITEEESARYVALYREKHKGIVAAWRSFFTCAKEAISKPRSVHSTCRCKIIYDRGFLRIKLPSGRVIQW